MRFTQTIKASVRSDFSAPQLLASARFSRHVARVERENQGKQFGPFWDEILHFSMACVFGSAASLESYVNALFADRTKYFPTTESDIVEKLWELSEQKPLLEKYEIALILRKGNTFDKGARPFQDVAALIRLRNALTHFRPEWDDEQQVHAKVSDFLRGRFEPSPFIAGEEPLFPTRWATSGCTKWAVCSVIDFVRDFEKLAGLEHYFDKFADRLGAE